jgi:ParB family chromosome partitioning protein
MADAPQKKEPAAAKPAGDELLDAEVARAFRRAEEELKSLLGTRVSIRGQDGKKKGRIEIEYYSSEELERLLSLFKKLG